MDGCHVGVEQKRWDMVGISQTQLRRWQWLIDEFYPSYSTLCPLLLSLPLWENFVTEILLKLCIRIRCGGRANRTKSFLNSRTQGSLHEQLGKNPSFWQNHFQSPICQMGSWIHIWAVTAWVWATLCVCVFRVRIKMGQSMVHPNQIMICVHLWRNQFCTSLTRRLCAYMYVVFFCFF